MSNSGVPLMGFEGRAYAAEAGSAPTTEIMNCRNLRIGASFTEVDTTVQGNRGIKSYSKGLQDFMLAWDQVVCDEPAASDALVMGAINSRTPVALHFVEQASGSGPKGTFHIFGGEQTMDGDGVQTIPCTARPATGYPPPTVATAPSGGNVSG